AGTACSGSASGSTCRAAPRWKPPVRCVITSKPLKRLHRNRKHHCVYYPLALELRPNSIFARARQDKVELYVWSAVGEYGMQVKEVDEIFTCCQHMRPGAQIGLESGGRLEVKEHFGLKPCKRLLGIEAQGCSEVLRS